MNSLIVKNKTPITLSLAAALALGTGCSSMHRQARYNAQPAPIAMNNGQAAEPYAAGGTGSSSDMQAGSASSWNQANAQSSDVVIPLQKEKLRVGTQQVNEGAVRIHKFVKTETISQPVTVRQESVTVDRLPANAAQGGAGSQSQASQGQLYGQNNTLNTPFKEGDLTINLSREQPVLQTEVVPAGSVVIHKKEFSQPINVQGQVRREEIVAEPIGNPQNVNISSDLKGSSQGANSGYSQNPANDASGGTPAATEQSSGAGSSSASGSAITQLNQLTSAPDAASLAGQTVNLSNAKVERVIGTSLVAISANGGTPIYIHSAQPLSGLSAGQMVSVNGTVKQVPASTSSLGWDPQSTQALQGQQIFIEAPSITPSNQGGNYGK